jgi:hypothetical protein
MSLPQKEAVKKFCSKQGEVTRKDHTNGCFLRHTGQFRETRRASEAQGWHKLLSYLKSHLENNVSKLLIFDEWARQVEGFTKTDLFYYSRQSSYLFSQRVSYASIIFGII